MKPWADFVVRVVASVAITLVLAPVVGVFLPGVPFHRVMTRIFQATLLVALLVRRGPPRTWPDKIRGLGLRGPFRRARFATGLVVGLVAMSAVLVASWLLGGRTVQDEPHRMWIVAHVAKAVFAGLAVALFEEALVRGYLKNAVGGLASAVLFAAVHFMQPRGTTVPAGPDYDPLLAVKRLHELVGAWGDRQEATLGFLSLFILALALNRLRERTGSLYFGIGLHAGIVIVIQLYRRFLHGVPVGNRWIHGGPLMRDGVLTLVAVLALLLAAYVAPLPRWARADVAPPA